MTTNYLSKTQRKAQKRRTRTISRSFERRKRGKMKKSLRKIPKLY